MKSQYGTRITIWGSEEEITKHVFMKARDTQNLEEWLASEIASNLHFEGLDADVEIEKISDNDHSLL